jgi:hypothetical protein
LFLCLEPRDPGCHFLHFLVGSTPPMPLGRALPRLLGPTRAKLLGHISPKSSSSLPIMKTFQWSIMIPSLKNVHYLWHLVLTTLILIKML